jgi:FKBP-type peptidyl-prolyl cis-trans isomerase FklB
MKRIGIAVLALGVWACSASAQDAPAALKTQKEKLSYAIGMEMGKGVKSQGLDVDPGIVSQGLKDAITGGKSLMSDDELQAVITALQEQMKQKQMQALEAAAAENKKQGDAFLAENGKKQGVVTLPSGLQYKIITAGQGKKPAETDTVLCNYKGTFLDGTEFDSSAQAGKPVPFEIKTVIPGFQEALQLMPVGSKWQIVIPSNLAYGERGAGGVIGPNATLIFEVELVSIQAGSDNAK